MSTASQVSKLYRTVVEDVINNVKEAFLDEGIDEQVLQELKSLWEHKLSSSKALEPPPEQEVLIAPQNVTMVIPPQPIQTTTHEQGAMAQPTQVQATTQFQLSPAAATATLALPSGLFQQQLATIGADGQIQNITVQQTGTGQYITLSGLPQQLSQLQQQQQRQQQPQLAQHITPQMLQQQQLRLPQQQGQPISIQQQPQQIRIQHHGQPQAGLQQQPKLLQASQLLQQAQATVPSQVNKSQGGIHQSLIQLDGNGDTSSSDDDDFDDDDKDEEEKEEENEEEEQGEEEDPLNSDDDVSEDDPAELFDTENVVVCQYDKINRNKNKWKFHLKDGIMNLNGRDFVFQKATGDAEW